MLFISIILYSWQEVAGKYSKAQVQKEQ